MNEERIKELKKEFALCLGTNQGEEVIRINQKMKQLQKNTILFEEMKKAKPEIIAFLKEEERQAIERKAEIERISDNANIVGYKMNIGCDSRDTKRFIYDAETTYRREQKDQKLADEIFNLIDSELAESLGGEALEPDLCSYGGWEFTQEKTMKLIEMAEQKIAEKEAIKQEKIDQAKKEEAEIFAIAKETNEKQLLKKYPIECQDEDESCDIDIVCIYAMPDGTRTKTVNHTW